MKKIALLLTLLYSSTTIFAQFESMMGAPKTANQDVKLGKNITDANGKKQGEWEKRTQEGNLIYKATFKDDKPVGELTRYYPNGRKKIVIDYDSLGLVGTAELFDEKENLIARGFYMENQKDSTWSYIDPYKNIICDENYKNGKHNGTTTYYYQNGIPFEIIPYKNEVKDGEWSQYFKNGKLKLKSQYINGKLVGSFKILFEDQRPEVVGFYNKDGKEDGVWKFYKTDGKVDYEIKYKNGKILNSDEIDRRKNERILQLEKNKNSVKDPEQYRNDPEGYMQGN